MCPCIRPLFPFDPLVIDESGSDAETDAGNDRRPAFQDMKKDIAENKRHAKRKQNSAEQIAFHGGSSSLLLCVLYHVQRHRCVKEVFNAASPLLQWWVRRFLLHIVCNKVHITHICDIIQV